MWSLLALFVSVAAAGQQPRHFPTQPFETETPMVHDPVMAYEDSTYHIFATGMGIQQMTSKDRKTWTVLPNPVMSVIPKWAHDSVPGFTHHVWAPDIIKWHNRWWMAYSCSTFGKNGSAIGLLSSLLAGNTALPYIVLSLTVTFLFFQQGFLSPVTWLLLSELFPAKLRGMGMGVTVLCLWLTNFCVGLSFPVLLSSFGLSSTFFIFAALGVFGLLFTFKFVPETKGRSLEQIEKDFRGNKERDEVHTAVIEH